MAHFGFSSCSQFAMLYSTISASKRNYIRAPTTNFCVYSSTTPRLFLQHRTKLTSLPFVKSWRNYCSNSDQKLSSGLTSEIDGDGHQVPLSDQTYKVELELGELEKSQPQGDLTDKTLRKLSVVSSEVETVVGDVHLMEVEKQVLLKDCFCNQIDDEPAQAGAQADGENVFSLLLNLIGIIDLIGLKNQQLSELGDPKAEPDESNKEVNTQEPKPSQQGATRKRMKRRASSKINTPTLNKYGTDMSELARKRKLDPVAGRESEIKRLIMILGRRRKNNPCLIGEPGVGKTAIIEGLAQLIVQRNVPTFLEGKRVISIDMGLLVAGTEYCGTFEDRLTKIIAEAKKNKDVILFIDEIHMLLGAGSHSKCDTDAADWLKPPLARGEIQCIGATTIKEYRMHIMKDGALERRFQPLKVLEPTVEETIKILRGLRRRYEEHHFVLFTDTALVSAAKLSHHYIRDRFLPDKAIDLIDEAASSVKLRHIEGTNFAAAGNDEIHEVAEDDIQEALSCWTGIPKEKVSVDASERLLRLEETLHASVVGQDEAVKAISRAVRRARAGIRNPHRPVANFIFSGPTGVGKTELAKALAACYYGSEDAMIRNDMSELLEKGSASKLVGAPPGTVGYDDGGQLTEAVHRCPHSIVLFDEIEKAHRSVFDIMLQIMDAGRLTDGQGRTVDFKNTMIIMTSNIGGHVINNANNNDEDYQAWVQRVVIEELQKVFRPEFLNRVDETIVFQQLKLVEVMKIAEMMLKEVGERLIEKKKIVAMHASKSFKEKVVREGYDRKYGARALRTAITRLLENSLADKILAGEINEGDVVEVDVGHFGNVLIHSQPRMLV